MHHQNQPHSTHRYLCHGVRDRLGLSRPERNKCTLSLKHIFSRTCFRCFGARTLNYFAFLQLIIKSLYFLNSVLQIFFLNIFLNTKFHRYGVDILSAVFASSDKGWWQSYHTNRRLDFEQNSRFPKVAYCDFRARELGTIHNHSLQCALTVNLFNEKVLFIVYGYEII